MAKVLDTDLIEASFTVEDSHGRPWVLHIAKAGGGTIPNKYDGEWFFTADLKESISESLHGSFTTGTPKDHAEAAAVGWEMIVERNGI